MKTAHHWPLWLLALLSTTVNTDAGGVCFKAITSEKRTPKPIYAKALGHSDEKTTKTEKFSMDGKTDNCETNKESSFEKFEACDESMGASFYQLKASSSTDSLTSKLSTTYGLWSDEIGKESIVRELTIAALKEGLILLEKNLREIEQHLPPNAVDIWFKNYEVPAIFTKLERETEELKRNVDYILEEDSNVILEKKFLEFFATLTNAKRSFQKIPGQLLSPRKEIKAPYVQSLILLVKKGRGLIIFAEEVLD